MSFLNLSAEFQSNWQKLFHFSTKDQLEHTLHNCGCFFWTSYCFHIELWEFWEFLEFLEFIEFTEFTEFLEFLELTWYIWYYIGQKQRLQAR